MLLGKRARGSMRRTTSISEFAFDINTTPEQPEQVQQIQQQQQEFFMQQQQLRRDVRNGGMAVGGGGKGDRLESRYLAAVATPRPVGGRQQRGNSADYMLETASFLKACGLCKRRLGPGRDTFMYRGDIAFCSLDCRQQMIKEEELKEKCSLQSMKNEQPPVNTGTEASSGSSGTVAAA